MNSIVGIDISMATLDCPESVFSDLPSRSSLQTVSSPPCVQVDTMLWQSWILCRGITHQGTCGSGKAPTR